jgi:acyl-CoA synthetase (NDP forming)
VILTPQSMTDIDNIADEVTNVAAQFEKPVYASFMGEADVASGISILQRRSIPHYILPESMCRAYAAALFFKGQKDVTDDPPWVALDADRAAATALLNAAAASGRRYLTEEQATTLLKLYGLPVLPSGIATTASEAASLGESIGFPVVLKVSSEDIVHKFDVGGVLVGISTRAQAEEGFGRVMAASRRANPAATIRGIFVQKMVTGGEEVILGVKRDRSFGPVIMFGLGGIFVEVFKDVRFRIAPVGPRAAGEMVSEIRAFRMLAGARGKKKRDVSGIEEAIQHLSALALDCPQINELDINPLIVLNEDEGAFVADARILLTN